MFKSFKIVEFRPKRDSIQMEETECIPPFLVHSLKLVYFLIFTFSILLSPFYFLIFTFSILLSHFLLSHFYFLIYTFSFLLSHFYFLIFTFSFLLSHFTFSLTLFSGRGGSIYIYFIDFKYIIYTFKNIIITVVNTIFIFLIFLENEVLLQDMYL